MTDGGDRACDRCRKPPPVCVCDRCDAVPTGIRVVVLQHPQEQDVLLGTVPLLERIAGAERRVGLSWPNLAGALGREPTGRWAVVWPMQLPREPSPEERAAPALQLDRAGRVVEGPPEGILLLDGSWSQAKALWWRNAWLVKLDRLLVQPRERSIYGRARKEPRPEFVSTLEAGVDALVALGEPEEVRTVARKAMRTLVQRVRDLPA